MTPQTSKTRIPPPRALVLCIDDDPLVLHFYEDFLPAHGYQTLTATDGLLGIQIAQHSCPDVILLDVMLRGLSGYDICRIIRADPTLRDIPIILVTVWGDPSVATIGREAGADPDAPENRRRPTHREGHCRGAGPPARPGSGVSEYRE